MIKSAASAVFLSKGCANSRLAHGLKFDIIRGCCARSGLVSEFLACAMAKNCALAVWLALPAEVLCTTSLWNTRNVCAGSSPQLHAVMGVEQSHLGVNWIMNS